jgi:hypothetical protein
MKRYLIVAIVFGLVMFIVGYQLKGGGILGAGTGIASSACTMGTSTSVAVGHQFGETILPAHSARAYAIIQQPVGATNTVSIKFGTGAPVVNQGFSLYSAAYGTSTDRLEIGRSTNFPYTGAIRAITNVGSSTVLVTSCNY